MKEKLWGEPWGLASSSLDESDGGKLASFISTTNSISLLDISYITEAVIEERRLSATISALSPGGSCSARLVADFEAGAGIVIAKDIANLRRALARIGGDNEDRTLNPLVGVLIAELREELTELDARIAGYERKIRELSRDSEICQRLRQVEGIGSVTATAPVAAVGDRS